MPARTRTCWPPAKRGFKTAQARLAYIYLHGLGGIPYDPVRGVGWLSVAASPETMPWIRRYSKRIWKVVPDRYVGRSRTRGRPLPREIRPRRNGRELQPQPTRGNAPDRTHLPVRRRGAARNLDGPRCVARSMVSRRDRYHLPEATFREALIKVPLRRKMVLPEGGRPALQRAARRVPRQTMETNWLRQGSFRCGARQNASLHRALAGAMEGPRLRRFSALSSHRSGRSCLTNGTWRWTICRWAT